MPTCPTVSMNQGQTGIHYPFICYCKTHAIWNSVPIFCWVRLGDIYLGLRDAEELAKSDPMLIWGGVAPALAMLVLMPTIAKVLLGNLDCKLRCWHQTCCRFSCTCKPLATLAFKLLFVPGHQSKLHCEFHKGVETPHLEVATRRTRKQLRRKARFVGLACAIRTCNTQRPVELYSASLPVAEKKKNRELLRGEKTMPFLEPHIHGLSWC